MEKEKKSSESKTPKEKNKKKAKSFDNEKKASTTPSNNEKLSKKPKSKSMEDKNAQSTPGGSNNTPNKERTPGGVKRTPRATPNKPKGNQNTWSNNRQFEPYMPVNMIVARGLATQHVGPGSLIQATLRINPKSYEDAFICTPDGSSDIYIKGVRDRNRALNGDLVIVEVDPPDKWNILHDCIQDYLETNGSEDDYKILHKSAVFNLKQENTMEESDIKDNANTYTAQIDNSVIVLDDEINDSSLVEDENPVTNAPMFGSKLAKVSVSNTPWDVSDINVDHLANDILQQVQINKDVTVKPKKTKNKQAVTIVAPDELESLDSTEDYESDVSDDLITAVEQSVVKMSALGLNPGEKLAEHVAAIENCPPQNANESSTVENTDQSGIDDKIGVFTIDDKSVDEKVCDATPNCDTNDDIIVETVVTTGDVANSNRKNTGKKEKKKSANESVIFQANRGSKPAKIPKVEFKLGDVIQHPLADQFLQRCGRVVNIVEFKHNRCAVGTLRPHADRNPRCALFSPTDSRIPRLNIPMEQCPDMFLQKWQEFSNTLFLARVESWESPGKAGGSLIKSLGDTDDINARTDAILYDLNIDFQEFSPEVLADLPPNHETWSIPPEEIKLRRDFRSECVFTIDPKTARDLDDALSITLNDDGVYTVGVHIADVSYFVREDTSLDLTASERTTSTYLAQRVIPMLPRPLCENLCSLNPGVDRLSYSVEWTIDQEGKILSEWFGRTVIRSCVKLSYDHAQMMIDEPDRKSWEDGIIPDIQEPFNQEIIAERVNMLQKLALVLRSKRESNGYLKISQPKLAFELNSDGMPYSFKVYEHKHSNKLIEEFMLLANMAVARKIYTIFPDLAVLRRHPPPKDNVMKTTLAALNAQNIQIQYSSAPELHKCLEKYEVEVPELAKVIRANLLKCMELAKYFCTGMLAPSMYSHFALNVPYYTHFTSPIRRYPDILVHRLLDYAVRGKVPHWDKTITQQLCSHSNDKRLAAKQASETSSLLFLGLFIAECGTIEQRGSVMKVLDHALDILLVDLGITRRVYTDKLDIKSFRTRRTNAVGFMDLVWKNGRKQTVSSFSTLTVNLVKGEKPFEFMAIIPPPNTNQEDEVITLD